MIHAVFISTALINSLYVCVHMCIRYDDTAAVNWHLKRKVNKIRSLHCFKLYSKSCI